MQGCWINLLVEYPHFPPRPPSPCSSCLPSHFSLPTKFLYIPGNKMTLHFWLQGQKWDLTGWGCRWECRGAPRIPRGLDSVVLPSSLSTHSEPCYEASTLSHFEPCYEEYHIDSQGKQLLSTSLPFFTCLWEKLCISLLLILFPSTGSEYCGKNFVLFTAVSPALGTLSST